MDDLHVIVKNEVDENLDELPCVPAEKPPTAEKKLFINLKPAAEDSEIAASPKPLAQSSRKIINDDNTRNLYPYSKKKIFETLLTKGCNSRKVREVMKKLSVAPEQAIDYFNSHAYNTQIHVHEECGSLSFENISDWLWSFEKYKLDNNCNFEAALIMKAIADNENHPTPKELDGIDLKSVYKFIGNALLGLPQPELDAKSAKFLSTEFESLIDDANSDLADTEVKYMKQSLEQDLNDVEPDKDVLRDRQSLDPLCLDSGILTFLK